MPAGQLDGRFAIATIATSAGRDGGQGLAATVCELVETALLDRTEVTVNNTAAKLGEPPGHSGAAVMPP